MVPSLVSTNLQRKFLQVLLETSRKLLPTMLVIITPAVIAVVVAVVEVEEDVVVEEVEEVEAVEEDVVVVAEAEVEIKTNEQTNKSTTITIISFVFLFYLLFVFSNIYIFPSFSLNNKTYKNKQLINILHSKKVSKNTNKKIRFLFLC